MTYKIGLFKPYKRLLFNDMTDDTNSWSRENVNLMKILASHGHEVYILSASDYDGSIHNIHQSTTRVQPLDFILVSNGLITDKQEDLLFVLAKKAGAKLVLLETDIALSTKNHRIDKYDLVLSQSKRPGTQYAHLEKLILYQHKVYTDSFESRDRLGVFIGFERDRFDKIKEFVMRPGMIWKGKGEKFYFTDKVNKQQLTKLLRKHLFSIVISGELQNKNGFVSQRYYENCLHGIINFVDKDYDRDELVIAKNDVRRVRSYEELYEKLRYLDEKIFNELQQKQFGEITLWLDGKLFYNQFIKLLGAEQ